MLVARASSGRKIPCRERHRIYASDHLVCLVRAVVDRARLAEGERFELSLGLPLSLISSQVPSNTQPPFRSFIANNLQMYLIFLFDNLRPSSHIPCVKVNQYQCYV